MAKAEAKTEALAVEPLTAEQDEQAKQAAMVRAVFDRTHDTSPQKKPIPIVIEVPQR